MTAPISARLSQSLSIQSNVSYELLARPTPDGDNVPVQLGSGKFAKVYKAWQRSARRNVRPVAIKVLHDYATLADERLFKQEIDLLKELTTVHAVNVIRTLDIVHLPPLAMCGCGVVYHPSCPRGCGLPLARKERIGSEYPFLHCPRCGWELSGEDVQQRAADLLRPPAKTCCLGGKPGPQGQPATPRGGTLINFVDREVVVMELIEHGLLDFAQLQRQALGRVQSAGDKHHGPGSRRPIEGSLHDPEPHGDWVGRAQRLWSPDRDEAVAQKVSLLQKVHLMVQLAEAVAWLHGEKRIVHKDLAPDNVMVERVGEDDGVHDWRGERGRPARELLFDLGSFPRYGLKVIDFGLSDKDELSRSWYEEQDVVASAVKMPYTSPEAKRRKERINERIDFLPDQAAFRVPRGLLSTYLSVMPGDLLADTADARHDHDLEIVSVEPDPSGRGHLAFFRGTPAEQAPSRQHEIVRRMGEPHDIYATGALFYYILTGQHEEVERLASLVTLLQEDQERELSPSALRVDKYYCGRRDAIPEPYFGDELLYLILRAMVRGRPGSFVTSRIERGPEPAQRLLAEIRALYSALQRDLLDAAVRQRFARAAALAVPAVGIGAILIAALAMRGC